MNCANCGDCNLSDLMFNQQVQGAPQTHQSVLEISRNTRIG